MAFLSHRFILALYLIFKSAAVDIVNLTFTSNGSPLLPGAVNNSDAVITVNTEDSDLSSAFNKKNLGTLDYGKVLVRKRKRSELLNSEEFTEKKELKVNYILNSRRYYVPITEDIDNLDYMSYVGRKNWESKDGLHLFKYKRSRI